MASRRRANDDFSVNQTEGTVIVYPDGRDDWVEIAIPYKLTAEMNPAGSERDQLVISIGDSTVTAFRIPVRNATGVLEREYGRR